MLTISTPLLGLPRTISESATPYERPAAAAHAFESRWEGQVAADSGHILHGHTPGLTQQPHAWQRLLARQHAAFATVRLS
jgi:hypothetical protein